jgi:phosphopantothenoylcysteine synthetase/decarboxylase
VLVPAAIGDYTPDRPASSDGGAVPLRATPKFLDAVRGRFGGVLVAFKAEAGADDKALLAKARALQERVRAELVVANDLGRVGASQTSALLVGAGGAEPFQGSKEQLAERVVARVGEALAHG